MIDISKESFLAWLSTKESSEVVGQQGQMYSNPVANWLRDEVKIYLESEVGEVYSWGMGVGIRNMHDGEGEGWYLNYHYTSAHPSLPGPGKYSGEIYLRIPSDIPMSDFGIPQGATVPMSAQECLAVIK